MEDPHSHEKAYCKEEAGYIETHARNYHGCVLLPNRQTEEGRVREEEREIVR